MWYVVLLFALTSHCYSNVEASRCDCGKDDAEHKISHGEDAVKSEFPMTALLQSQTHICGAVIITQRHALTAAHCTSGFNAKQLYLSVGLHHISDYSESYARVLYVEEVFDELYNEKSNRDDIALIQTTKKMSFSEFVAPACLHNGKLNLVGKEAVVAGWGSTQRSQSSEILQKINVQIHDMNYCKSKFKFRVSRSGKYICGMSGDRDNVCSGDSGGPMMIKNPKTGILTLVGIVSFGFSSPMGICPSSMPGIFTDVAPYLSWIERKIKNSGLKHCIMVSK